VLLNHFLKANMFVEEEHQQDDTTSTLMQKKDEKRSGRDFERNLYMELT